MDGKQLREIIVRPTLSFLSPEVPYSRAAEDLVMGTFAVESNLQWIKQHGKGPAKGLGQMEPATHKDMWRWLNLPKSRDIRGKVLSLLSSWPLDPEDQLQGNLPYCTAMTRLRYWVAPAPLPKADDLKGLAGYWKQYYNTALGKGTVEKFLEAYRWLAS